MAQTSYALMTNVGLAREAAAQSGGAQIVVTHIAIGDGATVPSGGETALYHEVARKAISGQGIVVGQSNVAYFEAFLAAADGPYTIREAGLFDSTGTMIAIAHFDPPINKTAPSSGAASEGTIRVQVAFSNTANVNILVDGAGLTVPLQKLTTLPDIPIISMSLTAAPASPAIGDTYVVAASPTGTWAGQAGKVAEYQIGGWSFITPKNGHIVSLPNGLTYIRIGGTYVPFLASETFAGLAELATAAETLAGTSRSLAVTPAGLLPLIADVRNADIPVINWQTTPPANPAIGDRYLVLAQAAGAWLGKFNQIATWDGTDWIFRVPAPGMIVNYWSASQNRAIVLLWNTAAWIEIGDGRLITRRAFTGNNTWTPQPGTNRIMVEAIGGGGAGGGALATGAGGYSAGSGGSAGTYAQAMYLSGQFPTTGVTVTPGAPGIASGTGGTGGNGATTSFGALLTLPGGIGGTSVANSVSQIASPGAPSSPATGTGILLSINGAIASSEGFVLPGVAFAVGGHGAASPLGSGGGPFAPATAVGYGAGGGGRYNLPNSPISVGGNGSPGIVIVTEYS